MKKLFFVLIALTLAVTSYARTYIVKFAIDETKVYYEYDSQSNYGCGNMAFTRPHKSGVPKSFRVEAEDEISARDKAIALCANFCNGETYLGTETVDVNKYCAKMRRNFDFVGID